MHLPSGRRARLSAEAAARAKGRSSKEDGPFAEALALLSAEGVLSDERGAPLDVYALPVRDVHTLRAIVAWCGLTTEEPAAYSCENCGAAFEVAPSSLFEPGPFLDGELSDPELDAPFPFGEALPIPRVILPALRAPLRRGTVAPAAPRGREARTADTVTFAERTTGEARALLRAADALLTGRARSLRVTPAIVLGMGVVALGTERRTPVLAEALAVAPRSAWAKIVEDWHDAAYPRRLFGLHRCAECGARNDLDVPLARELDREAPPRRSARGGRDPMPDLDAFEARVRAHAEELYEARGVRNIDLFVDAGVPACDDGGEPLLGSYVPGGVDEGTGVPRPPEIRLYYRTFKAEHEADPEFDVEAEIRETIDHELEHHLNHLAGDDPLDDEEREAIGAEAVRRVGAREAARRGRQALAADLGGFLRTTWPMWIVALIAAAILWWAER